MAASASDKLRKITNNFSTTLASGIGASDTTITLSSVTNLPTDTAVDLVIDRVDASGTKTPTKREYVLGVISGSNLISVVRGKGNSTAQVHASGAVVEYVWDQDVYNDHVDNHLQDHNQAGNHKSLTDNNGNDWIKQTATTSAVNQVTVANAATGNGPVISATGTDTNVDLTLTPKGTGQISMTKRYDGWVTGVPTFNTVVANGNRSYTCTVNSTDLTSYISAGMRVRTTRTVTAPTQCTSLNGTTQYYSRASASLAGMTFTNNFTTSAWVKLSSYPSSGTYGTIVSRYNGTSGWWLLITATGQVVLSGVNAGVANFTQVISYQSVPLNKWIHITAQLDMTVTTNSATTNYVMIDGVDVSAYVSRSGTNPTALVQAGNLEVGSYNGGITPIAGKIAQVAIFSAKVTQATIQGYISQGLSGSETSLVSAYSFNNSINDLNTTNANNLTANGSAVATNADSPFGAQADGTVSSTLDYGIITKISYSTNTTITVQVPEGCTIPTTGGVSAVSYSIQTNPYGIPNTDSITRYTRSVQNTSVASLTNTEADLRSYGLLQTITSYGSAVAQVRVDMGINSTTDYEFWPEVWVNGSRSKYISPAAALASASNRAQVRGFTCEIPLTDGTNIISAGYYLNSSSSAGLAINGGSLTVSIIKGYGTGN